MRRALRPGPWFLALVLAGCGGGGGAGGGGGPGGPPSPACIVLDGTPLGTLASDIDGGSLDKAYALVVQPGATLCETRIVVAGTVGTHSALVRYAYDGSPDTGFGNGSRVVHADFGSATAVYAATADASGRIVVAGSVFDAGGGNHDFLVARYDADGNLDTTFGGGDGKVTTDFTGRDDYVHAVAIDSQGRIVVAGTSCTSGTPCPKKGSPGSGPSDTVLARYLASGQLDADFDGDGRLRIDIRTDNDGAQALAIQQPDDMIVVAGFIGSFGAGPTMQDFLLARFASAGAPDTSFGADGDGVVREDFAGWNDSAAALGLDGQGRIVVAGTAFDGIDTDFAVARYDGAGALDTSGFRSPDGKVRLDVFGSGDEDHANALAILAGDAIEVAGSVDVGLPAFAFARFGADGAVVRVSGIEFFGYTTASPNALAVMPDGYLVGAGFAAHAADSDFALARVNP